MEAKLTPSLEGVLLDKLADKVDARREQLKQGTICPECKVSYLLLQTHRAGYGK